MLPTKFHFIWPSGLKCEKLKVMAKAHIALIARRAKNESLTQVEICFY